MEGKRRGIKHTLLILLNKLAKSDLAEASTWFREGRTIDTNFKMSFIQEVMTYLIGSQSSRELMFSDVRTRIDWIKCSNFNGLKRSPAS